MRVYDIHTNNRECVLSFVMNTSKPMQINIIGYDPNNNNTVYFNTSTGDRQKPINGLKKFSIKMPVSPKRLHLKVYDASTGNSDGVTVHKESIKLSKLPKSGLTSEHGYTQSFMDFARWFCHNSGHLKAGGTAYSDKNSGYDHIIKLSNEITDRNTGHYMETPARVGSQTGVVEISKKHFDKYTIPMRMFILCHEWSHHILNTRNEFVADSKGVDLYMAQGFPEVEGVYAFTKVFNGSSNDEKERRTEAVLNKIKRRSR